MSFRCFVNGAISAGRPRSSMSSFWIRPNSPESKRNIDKALRGYKDINLLAMQLIRPGGILATFSCSGLVSADLFQKVVFGAAVDAARPVQILEWLRQPADHPIAITFPEGEYLKGLICRVL